MKHLGVDTSAFVRLTVSVVLASTSWPASALQYGMPMLAGVERSQSERDTEPPLRLSESVASGPSTVLAAAVSNARDLIEEIGNWNRSGRVPAKNGFTRLLPSEVGFKLSSEGLNSVLGLEVGGGLFARNGSRIVWGASIEVTNAYRLRVELENVRLPAGSALWVWGEGHDPIEVDLSGVERGGSIWLPSVAGPLVHLEVAWLQGTSPSDQVELEIHQVLEQFQLDHEGNVAVEGDLLSMGGPSTTACLINAACVGDADVPGISLMKKAIAHLQFVDGGSSFICSGSLLNNTIQDGTPYLLTANHCLDSQATANSLEAFWDFIASGCPGSIPPLYSLPRSTGATLLATSPSSDFTFLRLQSAPGNRVFLGWNQSASAVSIGQALSRLHHPLGAPMSYSQSYAWNPPQTCGISTTNFLFSDPRPDLGLGATFGGSSGSAVLLPNGQVVGQLQGVCGPLAGDPCLAGPGDSVDDGRFSVTFPAIASYLNSGGTGQACAEGPNTACLLNDRFKIEIEWTDFQAVTRDANVASAGTPDSALFYFQDPNNWEFLIKAIDACGFNQKFWIFFAAATNVGYRVTVTDTVAGGPPKVYTNPVGNLAQAVNDINAFSCP